MNFSNSLRLRGIPPLLLWAALIGVIGALATIAFRDALSGLQYLLIGRSGSLVELATSLPWQRRIAIPVLGGMAAGLLLDYAKRRQQSEGTGDYMAAIAYRDGHITVTQTLLNSASSLSTIASGGSIGREGSMVQLAALCASLLGRFGKLQPEQLRTLVACGAAAGVASAYNAPIAAAFFVGEIVLGVIVMDSFGPLVVSAVIANITMREFPGYHPTYEMPNIPAIPMIEIAGFVILGLVMGILAPQFLKLLGASKEQVKRLKIPTPIKLAFGGLIVGVLSIWVPQVWGNGYSVVNSLLHTQWLWSTVLIVLLCKIVATTATVSTGAIGGVFTPTLFVGAAIGYLFGDVVHAIWPHAITPAYTFAIVGMGSFLAAATSAPIMAVLMIFEMTLSYQIMLPLLLACVLAYYISRSRGGSVMYEITLTRIREEKARMELLTLQMGELIQPALTVLPLDASLREVTNMFREFSVKYIYIVDSGNRYQGVVAVQDVASMFVSGEEHGDKTACDFLRPNFLNVVTPDMSLDEALKSFIAHEGERLPAIRSHEDPELLGVVKKTSLLDAYYRLNR